jgi:hypothetical protein
MSNVTASKTSEAIASWLEETLVLDPAVPVWVANRDQIRTRPCIVVKAGDFTRVPGTVYTGRGKVEVMVFSQIDITPIETHVAIATAVEAALVDIAAIKAFVDGTQFRLHDLLPRGGETDPDESRGRETIHTYEGVASACG